MDDFELAEMQVLGEGQEDSSDKFIKGYDYGKGAAKNG